MLARHQDAYGRAMLDRLHGVDATVAVERDDGYVDSDIPVAAYFAPYAEWPPYIRRAMKYVRGRVLDVGCGAGRHALYCQQKGLKVTAIDLSPLAVKVCRLRGVKDARVMSIAQVSRKLGTFDTILMMGNNFGLFGGFDRARRLLCRFHAITTPGARIVAECMDVYDTKDPYHLAYHRFNRRRGRMSGQLRLRIRYKTHMSPWFDYLFASRDEMREIVAGTGWRIERFVDPRGGRYVGVLAKE